MSTKKQDPFAPWTRENPVGYRTREFTVTAERVGEGDDAPLRIAISSEAPVERWGWDDSLRDTGGIYEEILDHGENGPDLSYVRDGLPFCLDHDLRKQIGIGTTPTLDRDGVLRTDVTRGNHPDAAWVFADMAAGVRKKVSIGYWPGERYTQVKRADGKIERRYQGWTLYEASSVAVPADYAVGVGRSALGAATTEQAGTPADSTETTMSVENTSERGAAPAPDTRAAELATLATNFPAHARLAEWISGNTSVDAARDEVMRKLQQAAEQRAPNNPTTQTQVTGVHNREEDKPWGSFTEFMRAVSQASTGRFDARLNAQRAATGMGIGSDPDGGFMIPEQYAQGVITRAFEGGDILSRCRRIPVSGNQYHMSLIDENSRANGSRWGGIQSYRLGEGTAVTVSKPKIRRATLDVTKKIGVACYVSEEQLQDATATDTILTQAMSEEVTVRTEGEVWAGIGGAENLGIMNSGALVTVAKVASQAADTIVAGNATKMNATLWAGSHRTAAWFINQMGLDQLPLMTIGDQPVYLPPTGVVGSSPFGTLLGKPVYVTEHAAVLGDVGDIVLADFSQYAIGEKAMNQIARSMHVKFLEGEEVFRLIYRVDGLPLWNAPLTLKDGTTQVSPFVTLAART